MQESISTGGEAIAGSSDYQGGEGLVAYRVTDIDATTMIVVARTFGGAVDAWRTRLVRDHELTPDEAAKAEPESVERISDKGEVILPQEVQDLARFAEELRSLLPDDLADAVRGEDAARASELCGLIRALHEVLS